MVWENAASSGLYESVWFEMMKRPLQLAGAGSSCQSQDGVVETVAAANNFSLQRTDN